MVGYSHLINLAYKTTWESYVATYMKEISGTERTILTVCLAYRTCSSGSWWNKELEHIYGAPFSPLLDKLMFYFHPCYFFSTLRIRHSSHFMFHIIHTSRIIHISQCVSVRFLLTLSTSLFFLFKIIETSQIVPYLYAQLCDSLQILHFSFSFIYSVAYSSYIIPSFHAHFYACADQGLYFRKWKIHTERQCTKLTFPHSQKGICNNWTELAWLCRDNWKHSVRFVEDWMKCAVKNEFNELCRRLS